MSRLRYFKRVDEANHDLGGEATYFLEVDEDVGVRPDPTGSAASWQILPRV
jgi:hypothetical protein